MMKPAAEVSGATSQAGGTHALGREAGERVGVRVVIGSRACMTGRRRPTSSMREHPGFGWRASGPVLIAAPLQKRVALTTISPFSSSRCPDITWTVSCGGFQFFPRSPGRCIDLWDHRAGVCILAIPGTRPLWYAHHPTVLSAPLAINVVLVAHP